VIVRDFKDLVCWRRAHALKCEVVDFTANGPASRDFKYCDQIRDSSASAPSNIAEAFGRYGPRDAARFCEFAIASLEETRNHLIDGCDRAYLTPALYSRLSISGTQRGEGHKELDALLEAGSLNPSEESCDSAAQNLTGATQNPTTVATQNPTVVAVQNNTGAAQNPTGAVQNPTGAA